MKICHGLIGYALYLLVISCGSTAPPLNIAPQPQDMYPGYKGDISRSGFIALDEVGEFAPLWQTKFRYPLFIQPVLAGDYIFQPGSDRKIHIVELNTGREVAEIKVRRHIGTVPELSGEYMAIGEIGPNAELLLINYIEGKLVWSVKTRYACFQPALFNNKIFWADSTNQINAAILANGKKLWSKKIASGFDTGPIIGDGRIYIAARDSSLVCLNPETGDIIWKTKMAGRTNSSPAYFGGAIYTCNINGLVTSFDALTGDIRWDFADKTRLFYSPSVDQIGVYFGSGDGRFIKLDCHSGEKIWEYQTGSPVRGTALINNNAVIFSSLDGIVYALDKITGKVLTSFSANGMISAAPVLYKDKLIIAAQDKFLNCFSLEGKK